MIKRCSVCGLEKTKDNRIINSRKLDKLLCSVCYQRENSNSEIHELPNYGEVKLSDKGLPICHICGKAYKKLMAHVWQVHEISAYDYKNKFGLETTKGIMSDESKNKARTHALNNADKVIHENLIKLGENTRYKKGSKGRTRELVSEQTLRKLKKRFMVEGETDDKV